MQCYSYFALLVAVTILNTVLAGFNPKICTPYKPSTKQPPEFPKVFSWRMEINENEKLTVDVEQWIDNYKQSLNVIYNGVQTTTLSDYKLGEQYILTYKPYYFDRGIPDCDVLQLNIAANEDVLYSSKSGPLSALLASRVITNRFRDDYPFIYIGESDIRGIPCDQYRTCGYQKQYDITFVMDLYLSKPGYQSVSGTDPVPVRAVAVGEAILKSGYVYPVNFVYELLFYRNDPIPAEIFQTPPGVSCPNRTNTTPVPKPPDRFQMRVEEIVHSNKLVFYVDEWYDFPAQLIRFDYAPVIPIPDYTYGLNPMTEIHDYNTGIAYLIDRYTNNCTAKPIYNSTSDSAPTDNPHYVRMRTAYELFGYDAVNFKYEGQKTVRGILCDVWVGSRTDWPSYYKTDTTWEMYWAADGWVDDSGMTGLAHEPIQQQIYFVKEETKITINTYKYNEEPISFRDFDISSCYHDDDRIEGQFQMSDEEGTNGIDFVSKNEFIFIEDVRKSIADAAKVSPIRITDIWIRYTNRLWVAFTLLNTPNVKGDVENPVDEPAISKAFENIETAINTGNLNVTLIKSDKTEVSLFAVSETLSENAKDPSVPEPEKMYSSGMMAGVACGTALIGLAIGGAIGYIVFLRR